MYASVYYKTAGRRAVLVDAGQATLVEPPGVGRNLHDDFWYVEWADNELTLSRYRGGDYYVVCSAAAE
jgi:hypothetical protein